MRRFHQQLNSLRRDIDFLRETLKRAFPCHIKSLIFSRELLKEKQKEVTKAIKSAIILDIAGIIGEYLPNEFQAILKKGLKKGLTEVQGIVKNGKSKETEKISFTFRGDEDGDTIITMGEFINCHVSDNYLKLSSGKIVCSIPYKIISRKLKTYKFELYNYIKEIDRDRGFSIKIDNKLVMSAEPSSSLIIGYTDVAKKEKEKLD